MGARLDEVDVLKDLVKTPEEFKDRVSRYLETASEEGRQVMVVYLTPTRDAMIEQGVDFNSVIGETCHKQVESICSC